MLEKQKDNFQQGQGNFYPCLSKFLHSICKWKSKEWHNSLAWWPCGMKLFAMLVHSLFCLPTPKQFLGFGDERPWKRGCSHSRLPKMASSVMRGLAITQTVFGAMMFLAAIVSLTIISVPHWSSSFVGLGVAVGFWVSFVIT